MEFQVDITGIQKLINKLQASVKDAVIKQSLDLGGALLAGWSKKNRLTGPRPQYLGVVTGRLRSSIAFTKTQHEGNTYFTKIGTNVVYGPQHEFGLTITKISSKGKSFQVKYPKRAFLSPAIEDQNNQQKILNILTENINEALNKE